PPSILYPLSLHDALPISDISTLGAAHLEPRLLATDLQQLERADGHRARLAFHLDALPGQAVQRLTIALQRGVHRWHLLDGAEVQDRKSTRLNSSHVKISY